MHLVISVGDQGVAEDKERVELCVYKPLGDIGGSVSAEHGVGLEKKAFLISNMEGATEDRRGRRKRFFTLTSFGIKTLKEIYDMRSEMVTSIPNLAIT